MSDDPVEQGYREKVPREAQVVTFDVDDTLVLNIKNNEDPPDALWFRSPGGYEVRLRPHHKHVAQVKRHFEAGHFVIIWSQQGCEWVNEVCDKLGLTQYTNVRCAKPFWYYDDLPVHEWFGERHYYPE